jgi:UDP-glucose 4-epimerase
VKDCGRAIALLMLADRLKHSIYNISSGRLVRYSEVVDAINAAIPDANITILKGSNPDRAPDNYLDITRLHPMQICNSCRVKLICRHGHAPQLV